MLLTRLSSVLVTLVLSIHGFSAYLDNWNWVKPEVCKSDFKDLIFAEDYFYAVNPGGGIIRSANGVDWEVSVPANGRWDINAIAYGNGIFVAVGDLGYILRSENGKDWIIYRFVEEDRVKSDFALFDTNKLMDVTYGDNGFMIVGGPILPLGGFDGACNALLSPDGMNWEAVLTVSDTESYSSNSVAYGAGKYYVASESKLSVSEDGRTWITKDLSDIVPEDKFQILRFEGGLLIDRVTRSPDIYSGSSAYGVEYLSSDGVSFVQALHTETNAFFMDEHWWTLVSSQQPKTAVIMQSSDGYRADGQIDFDVVVGEVEMNFASSPYFILSASGNEVVVLKFNSSLVTHSGGFWKNQLRFEPQTLIDDLMFSETTAVSLVSKNSIYSTATINTSHDLDEWNTQPLEISAGGSLQYKGGVFFYSDDNTSNTNRVYSSRNGYEWSECTRDGGNFDGFRGGKLQYFNGEFILSGSVGDKINHALLSKDGITWSVEEVELPNGSRIESFESNSVSCVAIDEYYGESRFDYWWGFYKSNDLRTWEEVKIYADALDTKIHSVAVLNDVFYAICEPAFYFSANDTGKQFLYNSVSGDQGSWMRQNLSKSNFPDLLSYVRNVSRVDKYLCFSAGKDDSDPLWHQLVDVSGFYLTSDCNTFRRVNFGYALNRYDRGIYSVQSYKLQIDRFNGRFWVYTPSGYLCSEPVEVIAEEEIESGYSYSSWFGAYKEKGEGALDHISLGTVEIKYDLEVGELAIESEELGRFHRVTNQDRNSLSLYSLDFDTIYKVSKHNDDLSIVEGSEDKFYNETSKSWTNRIGFAAINWKAQKVYFDAALQNMKNQLNKMYISLENGNRYDAHDALEYARLFKDALARNHSRVVAGLELTHPTDEASVKNDMESTMLTSNQDFSDAENFYSDH